MLGALRRSLHDKGQQACPIRPQNDRFPMRAQARFPPRKTGASAFLLDEPQAYFAANPGAAAGFQLSPEIHGFAQGKGASPW